MKAELQRFSGVNDDGFVPLWRLFPLFFAFIYASHFTLLRLPYFWDEGGYYIPAAWDFYTTGTLIPRSTMTNAHPPLPSILMAAWWHLSGYVPSGTRTLICLVAAAALLGVYRMARGLLGERAAVSVALLTAIYPVWFAQSTLAHADMFAAAFTLWGLGFYLSPGTEVERQIPFGNDNNRADNKRAGNKRAGNKRAGNKMAWAAVMFSLAALSKETSIVTPVALGCWEAWLWLRGRDRGLHLRWVLALWSPVVPLSAWYGYHYAKTGFVFGNPEFLRYNATANMSVHRIALTLYHRLLHLTMHMNMFVPVLCAAAVLLMPAIAGRPRLSRPVLAAIGVVLLANWVAFSVLGGALLTRYLLPMYALVLLVCVGEWQSRMRTWWPVAALACAGFAAGIWINPPYAFAPEDNLTYRDFIVLHQRAVAVIARKYPAATVLTAWPANAELGRPELGYTRRAIKTVSIDNFSVEQIEKAAAEPGTYDTALVFSTKWAPPAGRVNLSHAGEANDAKYFDFHEDLRPEEAARLLHGEVVWQQSLRGEWCAVLRFPRVVDAGLVR